MRSFGYGGISISRFYLDTQEKKLKFEDSPSDPCTAVPNSNLFLIQNSELGTVLTPKQIGLCYLLLSSDGTGTRRLSGSGRVLHYPALPGPGRVLR